VPVEVKAGLSRHGKSLRSYDTQYSPDLMIRTNLLKLKQDVKICNIPLYGISLLPAVVSSRA
jgi:hypothetical protein